MLRSYLTIAARNLLRHRGYAFINILGLAIGLAACVVILLYVRHELSYDRFHERADRIYRLGLDATLGGSEIHAALTSAPLGRTLVAELPEVEQAVRFYGSEERVVTYEDRSFYEAAWRWADSTVFDVFTFPLVKGNPATALARPGAVVLSARAARRYFGDGDPIGKTLTLDHEEDYTVTGVMADVPANTHLPIDFLASFTSLDWVQQDGWGNNSFYTYILLREGADPEAVWAKLPALARKYVAPQLEERLGMSYGQAVAGGFRWGYFLEALPDIYLYSTAEQDLSPHRDARYVYGLLAVAVFILLIACINFMNLSTARSAGRAKEVGIRKVVGSGRGQLIRQFLGESVLLAVIASLAAFVLVSVAASLLERLTGAPLLPGGAGAAAAFGLLLVVAAGTGLLAGIYPAFVLSSFQPAAVLKGGIAAGVRGVLLRRLLVVAQFGISLVLLVGTAVVFEQIRFMQDQQLGFAGAQVVIVPVKNTAVGNRVPALRQELLQHPGVVEVAGGSVYPGQFLNNGTGFRRAGAGQEMHGMWVGGVTHEYLETLQIELVAGRNFSRAFETDVNGAVLINETAARLLGLDPQEAVGQPLTEVSDETTRTIVGVVKDFHIEALHEPLKPIVLRATETGRHNGMHFLLVRIRPEGVGQTLAALEAGWKRIAPNAPFEYTFLEDDFGRLYDQERRFGMLFAVFAALAVFVACLGLFGLASFITAQRTKEIGVRKVLGASTVGIVLLLSKEFTKMVVLAALLAFPVAYLLMERWLQDFAFRTSLGPDVFVVAGVLALLVAWLTVSYQSIRAATADPVKSLRYE